MNEITPAPPNLPGEAVPHLAAAYIASLESPESRRGMESVIRGIASMMTQGRTSDHREIPWCHLTAAHVSAIMAQAKGAPATKSKVLAALRGIAKAGYQSGSIAAETWTKIQTVKGPRGSRVKKGRAIRADELLRIFSLCAADTSNAGIRDLALLSVATQTGMRRAELCALRAENLSREDDHWSGTVIGKGNKERRIFLMDDAVPPLDVWMGVRGDSPGPVFCPVANGRLRAGRGLTTTALHKILRKRMVQAGLIEMSWHDFRRTLITRLFAAGVDPSTIASLVGHADIATTQRYDRRGDEALRVAAAKIKLPKA
jgi:integrase